MKRAALMFVAFFAIVAAHDARAAESFRGVRLLKSRPGEVQWSVEFPADCPDCRLVTNEFTTAQNSKDFYFHFFAPEQQTVHALRVHVHGSKICRVICGRASVAFTKSRDAIVFDVPPQNADELVAEFHTKIQTPGVALRVEHADIERRNGPYAKGPWPAVQRAAALNLQFAAREAIRDLALDTRVVEQHLGVIQLMGFDTNYPTVAPDRAHDDFPPHWHMHVRWATDPKIRTIDHMFIEPNGLLSHNHVAKSKEASAKQRDGEFAATETFEVLTPADEVLFTQTITATGGLVLGAQSRTCELTPLRAGFQSGVRVTCGAHVQRVRAEDDLRKGRLRVFVDERLREEYFYDRDTGALTSAP